MKQIIELIVLCLILVCGMARQQSRASAGHSIRQSNETLDYPQDADLRMNDIQMHGTHNSYHVVPDTENKLNLFDYNFPNLTYQLEGGVRSLEIDIHWDEEEEIFEVYHIEVIDPESSCDTFEDCLKEIHDWSLENSCHHPLFIMVEPKDTFEEDEIQPHIDQVEKEILSIFNESEVIKPIEVLKNATSLREAVGINGSGWLTLGESRGRTLFFMDSTTEYDEIIYENIQDSLIWPAGKDNIEEEYAAIVVINGDRQIVDELTGVAIEEAASVGMIVRTRDIDVQDKIFDVIFTDDEDDGDDGEISDEEYERALKQFNQRARAGAHIISTEFPSRAGSRAFSVPVGGTPSTCNPVTAPANCTSEDIENPAKLTSCDGAR